MPPPEESDVDYGALYSRSFAQPANYIRFSQTVEECIGCQYDMTDEDDEFLKSYNQKRPASGQLSEDDFEQIMEVFEDTASISTPYASVDKTIVSYDMMVAGLHELQMPKVMNHAKDIYEYWRSRRAEEGGSLHPSLKFETHQDSDEMDPFVCFRRREVRQTRKTRARDIQSADKLKRLRRELEDGRQLVILAHEREIRKREMLRIDRAVYEQRAKLKETKIRLGIKTDDDDLVNQKVSHNNRGPLASCLMFANTPAATEEEGPRADAGATGAGLTSAGARAQRRPAHGDGPCAVARHACREGERAARRCDQADREPPAVEREPCRLDVRAVGADPRPERGGRIPASQDAVSDDASGLGELQRGRSRRRCHGAGRARGPVGVQVQGHASRDQCAGPQPAVPSADRPVEPVVDRSQEDAEPTARVIAVAVVAWEWWWWRQ